MIDQNLITPLTDAFGQVQQWLFESVVQPVAFAMGLGNFLEDAYAGTGWLLVGGVQLLVMLCLMYFTQTYGFYFYITWLPTYLRDARGA